MIGLIKKDILLIIKNITYVYLIAILVPIIPMVQIPKYLMIIATLIASLLFAVQTTETLSLDEASNWNKIVSAMPISIKEAIGSKYILSIFLSIIPSIIIFFIGIAAHNIAHLTLPIIALYVMTGFCTGILYNSIIIPAALKFGTQKCRFVLLIFIFIPITVNIGIQKLNININLNSLKLSLGQIMFITIFLVILFMLISYIISVRIQIKKYMFSGDK